MHPEEHERRGLALGGEKGHAHFEARAVSARAPWRCWGPRSRFLTAEVQEVEGVSGQKAEGFWKPGFGRAGPSAAPRRDCVELAPAHHDAGLEVTDYRHLLLDDLGHEHHQPPVRRAYCAPRPRRAV